MPKARTLADLLDVHAEIARLEHEHEHPEGEVGLIVVATETPLGVLNMRSSTECPTKAVDISTSSSIVACRRCSAPPPETCNRSTRSSPTSTMRTGLRRDRLEGAWMGFTGKVTIHPRQIDVVNELFTLSKVEVEEAEELLAAFDRAQRQGRMAFAHRGQMVDAPHLNRGRALLARARSAAIR